MKNRSIWSDIKNTNIKTLNNDITCDILIIGGGITGISTLYHLKDSNKKVVLVERNEIGSGITSKTTGKLTFLQQDLLSKIINYHGIEKAKLYLESQKNAIKIVKNIIKNENIACNFEQVRSYIFDDNKKILNKELNNYKKLNISVNEEDNFFYVNDTYVFHPLKYLFSLKQLLLSKENIKIFEHSKVTNIDKDADQFICSINNYKIKTKKIVLALHYPYFLLPFLTPFKTYIEKSYIEAYKVDNNLKYSAINLSKPTISTRFHSDNNDNYQLFLTEANNLSINNTDIKNFNKLLNHCQNPDYIWSNNDIMTNDSLPFIGSLNKDNSLLIGTGYNTWGMTNGSIAGKILADIILNKNNKYINLFNPYRALNKGKVINFPLILGNNIFSFTKSKMNLNKKWYSNRIRFEKRNGKNVGIYTDEANKEHIVFTICPHLKCSLHFNEIEKTWDCPCHGSRFDIDGKCIEGPSNYDISYQDKNE